MFFIIHINKKVCARRLIFAPVKPNSNLMKKKLFGLLFTGLLLMGAGLISPSNGVDDAVQREPLEMLAETMLIIFSAVLIYYTTGQAVKMKRSR